MLRKNYKFYLQIIIGAALVWIIFNQIQDALSGEEGRVRKFILQGKAIIESKNILACPDMISVSYHDKYDNEKQSLIYAAKEVFGYYKTILINIEDINIKLDDSKTRASVEITALVIGQTQQNKAESILEGENGRFMVRLVKEEKKWRLIELEFFEPVRIMNQSIG